MTTVLMRGTDRDAAAEPGDVAVDTDGRTAPAWEADDVVDLWGRQSFPASDPPANW